MKRLPGGVQVTFDCAQPAVLAAFWAEVLRYPPPDVDAFKARLRAEGVPEDQLDNWCAIGDPQGSRPWLFFQRVPEPKVVKNRVHLDVRATDIDHEAQRLVALGATKIERVTDESGAFIVMQDPEGNEFCVD